MDATATPFSGLGARDGGQAAAGDDFERDPIQRTVPAASAPPVAISGPAFPWPFRPATAVDTEPEPEAPADPVQPTAPAAASEQPEEEPMPRKPAKKTRSKPAAAPARAPRKVRAKRPGSPQFQLACVLLNAPDEGLSREEIAAQLDGISATQLANATWSMKNTGRIEHPTKGSTHWRLTSAGRDWATGGANLVKQQRGAPVDEKPARRGAVRLVPPAPAPGGDLVVVPVKSFKCALASDDTFALEKNGQRIELEFEETREMLEYLDRVGEAMAERHARRAA